ncbi:MAG: hypothetical protein NWR43_03255 [Alphaproteobacteria bacterium]|nr:hypothetical protein [Alphaproteobacteria bacterium]
MLSICIGQGFCSEALLEPRDFDPTDGKGKRLWTRVLIPERRGGLSEAEWAVNTTAIKPTLYYYHRADGSFWKKEVEEDTGLAED